MRTVTWKKATDATNLLVYEFIIAMETSGGDASWINGNNELHNRSIHNMVIVGLIDINKYENKWFYSE